MGQQRYALRYTRRMMCQHSRSGKCNREMMKVQLWADEDCDAGGKTQIVTTHAQPRTRNLLKHPRTTLQRAQLHRTFTHIAPFALWAAVHTSLGRREAAQVALAQLNGGGVVCLGLAAEDLGDFFNSIGGVFESELNVQSVT